MERNPEGLLRHWLEKLVTLDGSDLYVVAGSPPMAGVHGDLRALMKQPLRRADVDALVQVLLSEAQLQALKKKPELDLAYSLPSKARFRVNVYRERGRLAFVARRVKTEVPTVEELGLPPVLEKLAVLNRGMVLVVGATGTGKSTTLAAMVDHRNQRRSGHIVTIEDPIEFLHPHRRSIVSQRELGTDTDSYADALKSALRQAPSVVLIGEVRDRDTAEALLRVSETGHLVLSTLHASSCIQALERFVDLFEQERREQVYAHLSMELAGLVAQRLVHSPRHQRRFAALEIVVPSPRARELIAQRDLQTLREYMGEARGSADIQTFDDALFELIRSESIRLDDALPHADSISGLKMRMRKLETLRPQAPQIGGEFDLRMM